MICKFVLFLVLYSGMMRTSFSLEWKCPLVRDLLIKYLNGCISTTAIQDFMIFDGIPSGSADDIGLILDNASMSSFSFIWWNEKEFGCFVRNYSKLVIVGNFLTKVWSYILKKVIEVWHGTGVLTSLDERITVTWYRGTNLARWTDYCDMVPGY